MRRVQAGDVRLAEQVTRGDVSKRWPVLPKQAKHGDLSKSTIHEALLDLWMEHAGKGDRHPSQFTAEDWAEYHAMIAERSAARQRQG